MRINDQCLPCLVNQAIKTAKLCGLKERNELYKEVFLNLSAIDFSKTNPEIIGQNYQVIKRYVGLEDPYKELKAQYNQMFLEKLSEYDRKIISLKDAVKYAILANIIDFNPIHEDVERQIQHYFSNVDQLELVINHVESLTSDILNSKCILYLGDNCGEICFDKLLIQRIRQLNPECKVYFGVRGEAVVNDNTLEDAYQVGMQEVADVISNGDYSLGTVLERTSKEFQKVYDASDFVIAKGQANYESLNEQNKKIYFLLMTKCKVIADDIGVPAHSLICMCRHQFTEDNQ